MFSVNSYAKIKEVEDKGNYTVCKISIPKKDKLTKQYETTFVGKVRFVGQAHLQKPMADQRIQITSCGVNNCYTRDGKLEFLKSPTYVVFGYTLQDGSAVAATPLVEVDSEELPF